MRGALVAAMILFATPALGTGNGYSCLPQSLKSALAYVGSNYGKVTVISGYRKNSLIAGTRNKSKHASCRAVDFHVAKNKWAAIRWLKSQRLEVITYDCAMHHIHIATGSYRGHHCVNSRGVRK